MLFDSGNQRSYISKTLREELKLPAIRTENLKIKVFGNDKFKSEKVDIVPFILVGNKKHVTIEAICYPMTCSELSLADNAHHENKKIDLLIGMDYYYSCVSGTSLKGQPNEPIAP